MGLQISVTFTKMTTTFEILCSSLQTLAVPSGPLRCLLWSFAVLCGPLQTLAVPSGPLWSFVWLPCGPLRFFADPICPQRSFAVFVMVLCGPLRYLVRPPQTNNVASHWSIISLFFSYSSQMCGHSYYNIHK